MKPKRRIHSDPTAAEAFANLGNAANSAAGKEFPKEALDPNTVTSHGVVYRGGPESWHDLDPTA